MTKTQPWNRPDKGEWIVGCLATVPLSDCNYKGAATDATLAQAQQALDRVKASLGKGNKSKLAALEALVRKLTPKATAGVREATSWHKEHGEAVAEYDRIRAGGVTAEIVDGEEGGYVVRSWVVSK